jgi:hypothetical protein
MGTQKPGVGVFLIPMKIEVPDTRMRKRLNRERKTRKR